MTTGGVRRRRRWLVAIVFLPIAYVAWDRCPSPLRRPVVEVACGIDGDSFPCAVRHVSGPAPVDACWTVAVECANGAAVYASHCERLMAGQGVVAIVRPRDGPPGRCDTVIRAAVENVIVNRAE